MAEPIDLYFWPTPNGQKVAIFLEESGLPYNVVPVNLGEGEQFDPGFLEISPNNKMPAIVDPDGPDGERMSLFESGAILIYLADKIGALYPQGPRQRYQVMEWLMFQMGGVGPMLGQTHHFRMAASEDVPYAVQRYTEEAARLYRVMDGHLAESTYFAGEDYTIADISVYPWIYPDGQGQRIGDYPNLARWHEAVGQRPAVQKALKVGKD